MNGQKNRLEGAHASADEAPFSQIRIRYTVNECGCGQFYPERDMVVAPGPYSIDVPVGKHPDPNDPHAYYMLMEDPSGAPSSGVIEPGEKRILKLCCVRLRCPAGSAFDPVTCECSFI